MSFPAPSLATMRFGAGVIPESPEEASALDELINLDDISFAAIAELVAERRELSEEDTASLDTDFEDSENGYVIDQPTSGE